MKGSVSERLKQIMAERNLKQVQILELCKPLCSIYGVKLNKNDLSQYVSGKVVPGPAKMEILAQALDVSEGWLRGYSILPGMSEQHEGDDKVFDVIRTYCGDLAVDAVSLFVQLDNVDKGRIIGNMENMLQAPKYTPLQLRP